MIRSLEEVGSKDIMVSGPPHLGRRRSTNAWRDMTNDDDPLISSSLLRTYLSYHEEGSMSTIDAQRIGGYTC